MDDDDAEKPAPAQVTFSGETFYSVPRTTKADCTKCDFHPASHDDHCNATSCANVIFLNLHNFLLHKLTS